MKVVANSHVLGAGEMKAKGQMTSAPDKCVDLIMAIGPGGLNKKKKISGLAGGMVNIW